MDTTRADALSIKFATPTDRDLASGNKLRGFPVANRRPAHRLSPYFETAFNPEYLFEPAMVEMGFQADNLSAGYNAGHNNVPVTVRPLQSVPYVNPKASAYGYSFWRLSGGANGLAPAAQYGGSQSGLMGTYRLGQSANAIAFLWRVSVSHAPGGEREFTLGGRWQPLVNVPITLSAERRFRANAPDNIAIYAAGGKSDVPLAAKFKLDTFAQAGIIAGARPDRFFDAYARIDRPLLKSAAISIHGGGGIWAGGQKDATRIDIGPSIRTDFNVNTTRLRLNADWRFRVAGNAVPGNGPTITLSTSF